MAEESIEVFDSGTKMVPPPAISCSEEEAEKVINLRAEIDTSAPFESVKEAANRFGGMGFWKPSSQKPPSSSSPKEVYVLFHMRSINFPPMRCLTLRYNGISFFFFCVIS